MKYAVLIYSAEAGDTFESLPESEQQSLMGEYMALSEQAIGGAQLQPGDTATTVRVDNGSTLTTDGSSAAST